MVADFDDDWEEDLEVVVVLEDVLEDVFDVEDVEQRRNEFDGAEV